LRPEGRIVKIIHSVNHEKNQIVTIDFDKSSKLVFATPIDENIPKIFIKMKKINRMEFLKKVENDFNFKKVS
jgi:exoribonuclease R